MAQYDSQFLDPISTELLTEAVLSLLADQRSRISQKQWAYYQDCQERRRACWYRFLCPRCRYRRQQATVAQMEAAIESLDPYLGVFEVTVTLRPVPVEEVGREVRHISASWRRLRRKFKKRRRGFEGYAGDLAMIEVSATADNLANVHIHALVFMQPGARLTGLPSKWSAVARTCGPPQVDVRNLGSLYQSEHGIREFTKYATKPAGLQGNGRFESAVEFARWAMEVQVRVAGTHLCLHGGVVDQHWKAADSDEIKDRMRICREIEKASKAAGQGSAVSSSASPFPGVWPFTADLTQEADAAMEYSSE